MTAARPNGRGAAHQSARRPGGGRGNRSRERGSPLTAGGEEQRRVGGGGGWGDDGGRGQLPPPLPVRRPAAPPSRCRRYLFEARLPQLEGGIVRRLRHSLRALLSATLNSLPPPAGPAPYGAAALIGRGSPAAPARHAGKWSPPASPKPHGRRSPSGGREGDAGRRRPRPPCQPIGRGAAARGSMGNGVRRGEAPGARREMCFGGKLRGAPTGRRGRQERGLSSGRGVWVGCTR